MSLDPLISAAEFSQGTNGVISADDPRVHGIIAGASAAVRAYCGWHIGPVVDQFLFVDGPGGRELTLPTMRVVDLKKILYRGQEIDHDSYSWSESGQVRLHSGFWPSGYRALTVHIEHGFEDFADVRQVVQQVASNAIASSMGATREQAGGVSVSWALTAPNVSGGVSLLQRDLAVLDAYKIRRA